MMDGRYGIMEMVHKYVFPSFFILFTLQGVFSQESEPTDSIAQKQYIILQGDNVPLTEIALDEVIVFDRLHFDSYEERVKYYRLQRKTLKVYPYAKLAAERLLVMNQRLTQITSKSKKRVYTKRCQKYIEEEFTEELKKLTRTEGQILVKLIHRQTGHTTFNLVKEIRSGWRAFWYNTTAKMFDISLKTPFDPVAVQEDYLIEDILQRAFADGTLQQQHTALDYNYLELTNKWEKNTVSRE